MEKGDLVAIYGNDKKAIEFYKKSLEMEPENSMVYFNMGVAYGELEKFEEAVAAIDRAIELDPSQGIFYYGRGRIYLMFGDKSKAFEDFKIAADAGNSDALDYLSGTGIVQ